MSDKTSTPGETVGDAAEAFVQDLVKREKYDLSAENGVSWGYLWHGWALRDAFYAGARWVENLASLHSEKGHTREGPRGDVTAVNLQAAATEGRDGDAGSGEDLDRDPPAPASTFSSDKKSTRWPHPELAIENSEAYKLAQELAVGDRIDIRVREMTLARELLKAAETIALQRAMLATRPSALSARGDIERDAARYRKLRTQAYRTSDMEPPHWCIPETCGLGADIDDAIDKLK